MNIIGGYTGFNSVRLWNPLTEWKSNSLTLWYDAQTPQTITHASNRLTQWSDKSGNANHGNASGTARPLYNESNSNFNNLPTVESDSSTVILTTTAKFHAATGFGALYDVSGSLGTSPYVQSFGIASKTLVSGTIYTKAIIWPAGSFSSGVHWTDGTADTEQSTSNPSPPAAGACFIIFRATGTHGTNFPRLIDNGGTLSYLFNRENVTAALAGAIGEVFVVTGTITTAQIDKSFGYLNWKWGNQASLPSNHPYRHAAPLAYDETSDYQQTEKGLWRPRRKLLTPKNKFLKAA